MNNPRHDNSPDDNTEPVWGDTLSEKKLPPKKKTFRDPVPDEKLGSGICKEKLGEGGMGRVYLIWNSKFEMHRAVKLIPDSANTTVTQRFIQEAKVTCQLNHPNIVKVHDYDTWNEYYFIEMEYVKGASLDLILDTRGAFDTVTALAITSIVCNALQYAHTHTLQLGGKTREGLIHRDLKPANIMLSESGIVKLMDFGIALPLGDTVTRLTAGGGTVGSYAYMPPEQLEPNAHLDIRADIYSLGAVLFELLAGEPAFHSDNPYLLMKMIKQGEHRSLREIRPDVPAPVEEIVRKSLSRRTKDRYTDMAAFGTEIGLVFAALTGETPEQIVKKWMAGQPVQKNAPEKILKVKTAAHTSRLKKIRKPLIIGGAVVMIATVLFLLFTIKNKPDTAAGTVPVPLYPQEKQVVTAGDCRFSWSGTVRGAEQFIVQVGTDMTFGDSLQVNRPVSDTFMIARLSGCTERWFWRVGVAGKDTLWSEVTSFECSAVELVPPVAVAPPDESTIESDTIVLRWSTGNKEQSVRLQLAKTERFRPVVRDTILTDTLLKFTGFANGTSWYWRVGTISKEGKKAAWSEVMAFSVNREQKEVSVDSMDLLRRKYGTRDEYELARKTIYEAHDKDALYMLSRMKKSFKRDSLVLQLSKILLEKNMVTVAEKVLKKARLTEDGYAWLYRAMRHARYGRYKKVIGACNRAAEKNTILDSSFVENEAIYLRAVAADSCYQHDKTQANLNTAIAHWRQVIKKYMALRKTTGKRHSREVEARKRNHYLSKEKPPKK